MSDQPTKSHPRLSKDEIEQLRPHEGLTAEEFDKLRQNNQPSALQQVRNGDILPVEKQTDPEPAPEVEEAPKPAARKTAAKKTTARKTTTAKKAASRSGKK